jgi:hypothetical protein
LATISTNWPRSWIRPSSGASGCTASTLEVAADLDRHRDEGQLLLVDAWRLRKRGSSARASITERGFSSIRPRMPSPGWYCTPVGPEG